MDGEEVRGSGMTFSFHHLHPIALCAAVHGCLLNWITHGHCFNKKVPWHTVTLKIFFASKKKYIFIHKKKIKAFFRQWWWRVSGGLGGVGEMTPRRQLSQPYQRRRGQNKELVSYLHTLYHTHTHTPLENQVVRLRLRLHLTELWCHRILYVTFCMVPFWQFIFDIDNKRSAHKGYRTVPCFYIREESVWYKQADAIWLSKRPDWIRFVMTLH